MDPPVHTPTVSSNTVNMTRIKKKSSKCGDQKQEWKRQK